MLAVIIAVKFVTMIIDYRQLNKYSDKNPEPYLYSMITDKEFVDSQVYNHEKHSFGMVHGIFDFILDLIYLNF